MCPKNKWNIKCPYTMKAEEFTVHNTANKASAKAEVSYMVGNNNEVSYHYAIDDTQIVQGIEENRNTWHAEDGSKGRGNRKAISIEICHSTNPDSNKFNKAEKLAAKFIAYKLKEKGWKINKVKKHQDYSGKYCPHKTLDLGWKRFTNMIQKELDELNKTKKKTENKKTFKSYKVKITADVLNVRAGAGKNYKVNTTIKYNEVYTIVDEKNGWGKLKSGAGWISLDYTKKV
jgi:N-acetylmuramoyl-L-alanine amidase CwlA